MIDFYTLDSPVNMFFKAASQGKLPLKLMFQKCASNVAYTTILQMDSRNRASISHHL